MQSTLFHDLGQLQQQRSNLMGLKVSIMLKPPKVITNYKRAHSAWNPSEKIVLQDRPKKVPNISVPRIYGYFVHISGKNTKRRRFPLIYERQSGQPCWHIFYGEKEKQDKHSFYCFLALCFSFMKIYTT